MQTFTKDEIEWTTYVLNTRAVQMRKMSTEEDMPDVEKSMLAMRADQLNDIARRLLEALTHGDKRIEIK